MFGEEKLFGTTKLIIDDKKRLSLPASTNREPGEQLVIIKDRDLKLFRIYNAEEYNKLFDIINEKILSATTSAEEKLFKKKLLELSKTIIRCTKVDKSGRITLGEHFKAKQKIDLIGASNHMILQIKK